MPVVSVKIGDHCYHGLCDIGASVSAIPFSLYEEIKDEIIGLSFIDAPPTDPLKQYLLDHENDMHMNERN